MATFTDPKYLKELKDFSFSEMLKYCEDFDCDDIIDVDFRGTDLEELPDNFNGFASLDLRGTPIKKLPENLTVFGVLGLNNTDIKELPQSLKIGGRIYCSYGMGEQLRRSLEANGNPNIDPEQVEEIEDDWW